MEYKSLTLTILVISLLLINILIIPLISAQQATGRFSITAEAVENAEDEHENCLSKELGHVCGDEDVGFIGKIKQLFRSILDIFR